MRNFLSVLMAAICGLALGLAITWVAGESPWHVAAVLGRSAFGSRYDLGMTLFYTTPLIFTGLSVAMAFQTGLFNVGAEGQMTMGALAAAAIGALSPSLPVFLAPPLAIAGAVIAGGCWGALPGWMRVKRGSHEVITTIMLNFIAASLASYVTLYLLKNPESQNPETIAIRPEFTLAQWSWFGGAPVGWALVLAVLTSLATNIFVWKSVAGFKFRAMGYNETAAGFAGLNAGQIRIGAMALAGAIAGMAGIAEVLGNAHRFKPGFSPGYGLMGIAVALLARNRPVMVLFAALLFGALRKGAMDLDLETEHVTRELSSVLQAAIILLLGAERLWKWRDNQPRTSAVT